MNAAKDITDVIRKRVAQKKANAAKDKKVPPSADSNALMEWTGTIFYDRARKEYLILDAKRDWFPINETMLRRHCKRRGIAVTKPDDHPCSQFDDFVCQLQENRGVAYAGPLAGHPKGPREVNGVAILITSNPILIEPAKGD